MSLFSDIAGLAAINTAYNKLGTVGTSAQTAANQLAVDVEGKTKFVPYGVSTGTGGATFTDQSLKLGPTGTAQLVQNALLSRALEETSKNRGEKYPELATLGGELLGNVGATLGQDISGAPQTDALLNRAGQASEQFIDEARVGTQAREQAIFDRIRAAQMPEEERQRLMLEERLANQGRLGVTTNLFGGTPEQLALSKAQAEARNTAMLQAMQQAQAERAQAGALGAKFAGTTGALSQIADDLLTTRQGRGLQLAQSALGLLAGQQALQSAQFERGLGATKAAFIPEAASLNALQQALNASKLRQLGQLEGAGMFGEATATGIDALLASGLGQANLVGDVGAGVLAAGASSGQGGLFDFVSDLIKQISDVRLKENIMPLGANKQGFNLYKWDWNKAANALGKYGSEVGVLAQELLETHPERVSIHDSGYYQVDYTGIWR
jgi:hypothetical protein